MARIVRLEHKWTDSRGYLYYKPLRRSAEWASAILNKEFRNQCLRGVKPKGSWALLIVFEEGEEMDEANHVPGIPRRR